MIAPACQEEHGLTPIGPVSIGGKFDLIRDQAEGEIEDQIQEQIRDQAEGKFSTKSGKGIGRRIRIS